MSHRAIYAVREQGVVELFTSRWGALTVPQDVFWGPAWAEAFMRSLDPTAEWLDEVWAEGAAALDKDQRRITLYGVELEATALFQRLMQAVWGSAWTVRYDRSLVNVAATVGVPARVVKAHRVPFVIGLDRIGQNLSRGVAHATLVRVRRGESWTECVVDFSATALLQNGAEAFLARVDALPTFAAFVEVWRAAPVERRSVTLGDALDAVVIDVSARRLTLCLPAYDRAAAADLARVWPEWIIEHVDDLARLLADAARAPDEALVRTPPPPPPPRPTVEQQLMEIERALFGAAARKAEVAAFAREVVAAVSDGPVIVAPGFLDAVPTVAPDAARQRAVFDAAVAACRVV